MRTPTGPGDLGALGAGAEGASPVRKNRAIEANVARALPRAGPPVRKKGAHGRG